MKTAPRSWPGGLGPEGIVQEPHEALQVLPAEARAVVIVLQEVEATVMLFSYGKSLYMSFRWAIRLQTISFFCLSTVTPILYCPILILYFPGYPLICSRYPRTNGFSHIRSSKTAFSAWAWTTSGSLASSFKKRFLYSTFHIFFQTPIKVSCLVNRKLFIIGYVIN